MIESIRFARYVPALTLMGLIFFLSAQPDLGTGLGAWDLVLRKLAHVIEYALLFLLWVFAFRGRRLGLAAAIAIAYAITDELHQTTVDGRVGSPVDVLIDATGVVLAALALRLLRARAHRVRDSHARDRARPVQPDARGAA